VAAELLRRTIQAAAPSAGTMELSDGRVENLYMVREAIRQNIKAHLHIPDLAHRAGMNEQYFKSGFRQVFGMTPFKYLEYERLKAAKTLLKESRESIQLVAEQTGFKEASSFIRMFIKAEGISPSDWRRRSRRSDLL
jgi:transcriptional regulator GlxA family with amidase domain